MSQPPQPPGQEAPSAPAVPPVWTGAAGWSGPGTPEGGPDSGRWMPPQGGWTPPQGGWPPPWQAPGFPAPPVMEPRSTGRSPLVLALVALAALLAGVVAGFVIAAIAFTVGGMGWYMGPGMHMGPGMGQGLGPAEEFPAVPPGDLGPDPVLDEYADACFAGDLQACDDLFFESPPLSEYEEYGTTCGGRVKAFDVMACTDLE